MTSSHPGPAASTAPWIYVADGAGFRTNISTNKQETTPFLAASASYNTAPAVAAYAVPTAVAAPVSTAKATSYSSAINQRTIHAAPVSVAASVLFARIAAPVLSFPISMSVLSALIAAPVLSAPIAVAKSTSYSSAVNHGTIYAAPVLSVSVAAPVLSAPVAASVVSAPIVVARL
ncbi:hypothetical protein BIW11_03405 [Tropilaelaps mercedesae]|uniref:Uncharacterized protein n=1 Tax=Tropilaelaps mercedesae TaxID=418985 RepID=A0A1V9XM13_9ACAR|nr:hypothetical protein BIW11_03405 [Tropilaelaps mercedesae]